MMKLRKNTGRKRKLKKYWKRTRMKKHQGVYVSKCITVEVNGSMVKHVKGRKNKANAILNQIQRN